jgi:hypothetical protein
MDNRLTQLLQMQQPQQPDWMQQLDDQNFGPQDSTIASAINHPLTGIERALQWIEDNMHTAAGMPQETGDEGDIYGYAPSPEEQAQAGINLGGMAELGSMPMAPMSRGGTLGTTAIPDDSFVNGYSYDTGFQGQGGHFDPQIMQQSGQYYNAHGGNTMPPAMSNNKLMEFLQNIRQQ